jgi:intracellular multiplication protein IcmP
VSQGNRSPHEEFIIPVCIFIILFFVAWAVWTFWHTPLTQAITKVRLGELYLDEMIFKANYHLQDGNGNVQYVGTWRSWLPKQKIPDLDPDGQLNLIETSTYIAVLPLKGFFVGIMALMGGLILMYGPGNHYRRRMGLEGLMREQAQSFPAIQPFLKFDPRKLPNRPPGKPVPSTLPLFSEQLSPEEWIAYHEIPVVNNVLDRNRAYEALGKQLGKRWTGPEALPLHAQGMYAACCLKSIRARDAAEELLSGLSLAWSADGGFNPPAKLKAKIKSVIRDPKAGGTMRPFCDLHAWETTALLRALMRSRLEGGVLAPAQFLWLRGHDRVLWYPMNNLGRKSYCAEAVGAMVHFTNELIAEQKIPTPRFDEVIAGIEKYLKSGAARPIPELDKKAGGGKYWK